MHREVARILGLDAELCSAIDKLIDSRHPTIAEIIEYLRKLHQALAGALGLEDYEASLETYSTNYLGHDYGCKPSEFPLMYSYIYDRYGTDGCTCMVLHCVLDYIAHLIRKGYAKDLIHENVLQLIDDYKQKCADLDMCKNYDQVLDFIKNCMSRSLENIIVAVVERYVQEKLNDVEITANALSEILKIYLKVLIFLKGYRGKQGFSVGVEGQRIFMKLLPQAKKLLYDRLYDLAMYKHIDFRNVLEAMNTFRRLNPRTLSDVYKYLETLALNNNDFARALSAILQIIREFDNQIPRKEL